MNSISNILFPELTFCHMHMLIEQVTIGLIDFMFSGNPKRHWTTETTGSHKYAQAGGPACTKSALLACEMWRSAGSCLPPQAILHPDCSRSIWVWLKTKKAGVIPFLGTMF